MAWARNIAILVIVIMSGFMLNILLHDSMGHGVGMDTFNAGMADPWRAFIGQDLVSGLFFTVSWLVFRERGGRVIDTIAWAWMALWWGNIVIAALGYTAGFLPIILSLVLLALSAKGTRTSFA
jgi:hypothetical protein